MSRNPYSWKHFLKDYFVFSKGERNALIVLMGCMLLAAAFPFVYDAFLNEKKEQLPAITLTELKELEQKDTAADNDIETPHKTRVEHYETPAISAAENHFETFVFDPNTASADDWKRLGIRDKTIETIGKYRTKGGRFYKPADLAKIYGLRPFEIERLLPFVKISAATFDDKATHGQPVAAAKEKKPLLVDINTADTTQWIALPGIGSKLAARIVKYRDLLGGFYAPAQVGEVYGLPDSTFQKLRPFLKLNTPVLVKRNINTASVNELRTPYIPYNVANAIVQYRNSNGAFSSIADIKKIPLIDQALFEKIAPYLAVQ